MDVVGGELEKNTIDPPVKEKDETPLPFTDISESDPFYGDVLYVYDYGIMNGTSDIIFTPFGTLTRGMIVTMRLSPAG